MEELIAVKTCYRCDNMGTLEFKENYELTNHDTDLPELYSGWVCQECGCFHSEDNSFVEFLCQSELHTKYNVKSWLN